MNIFFAIVSYGVQPEESETFQTLYQSFLKHRNNEELSMFIFDNTENKNWNIELPQAEFLKIEYYRDSSNPGISSAYNHIAKFAKENNFKWIVFLDQDSELSPEAYAKYQQFAKENSFPIGAPKIFVNNLLISPSRMFFERTKLIPQEEIMDKTSLKINNLTCINTGLIVKTDFFHEVGGYNPNLKIDFCDHDFITRVANNTENIGILDFRIHQDFSANTNSLEKDIIRYRIFVHDFKSYMKTKNSPIGYITVDLSHLLKLTIKHRSLEFLKIRFGN